MLKIIFFHQIPSHVKLVLDFHENEKAEIALILKLNAALSND